jgi:hypothetical protein
VGGLGRWRESEGEVAHARSNKRSRALQESCDRRELSKGMPAEARQQAVRSLIPHKSQFGD